MIPPRPRPKPLFRLTKGGVPVYDGVVLRRRNDGSWHYRGPAGTFHAFVDEDGLVHTRDQISRDATDALMRRLGKDPYAAEKMRFAKATQRWRTRIRRRFKKRVRIKALKRVRRYRAHCLRYDRLGGSGKKRYRRWLFLRWDETREDSVGQPLRRLIENVIRRCSIRYPRAELRALNRRRTSRARFLHKKPGKAGK